MDSHGSIRVVLIVVLLATLAAPAAAAPPDRQAGTAGPADECTNAAAGSADRGPPGFVAGLVPDFLSDLFATLPVPNGVKAAFGAPTC